MLDIKYLRNNLESVAALLAIKGYTFDQEHFTSLDAARKHSDVALQDLQAQRKRTSKKIGELVQSGHSVEDAKASVDEMLRDIDTSMDTAKQRAADVDQQIQALLYDIPNIPDQSVPAGDNESDNVEVAQWGAIPAFDFPVRDHVALGGLTHGLETDTASAMSGARFSVLRGGLARLHRALAQYMLNEHTESHGYTEVNVPLLVNTAALTGTGQLPKFEEDLFKLRHDNDFYLIPTAEVPVTNLSRERIYEPDELPCCSVAHTVCFRSEAGSHGRDTRGLIRQHQFEKIELVQVVAPSESDAALERLTAHAETTLQGLALPYRKVVLCGGDLSFSSAKTYDLEDINVGYQAMRDGENIRGMVMY